MILRDSLDVFLLFIIPFGGGIPAGVILGNNRGLSWPMIMFMYFLSDCLLAVCFDPIMHRVRKSAAFSRINPQLKTEYVKNMERFGFKPNFFSLLIFTFGSDPMSGRVATFIAGHGFLSGWAIAIAGDMVFFTVVMVSTLYLNSLLGDGTWAAVIVMVVLLGGPALWRRFRASTPPDQK